MYCVKCRRTTGTNSIERVVTKNNRNMLRGKCDICGSTKTQFIKADVGKGVVNKLINNLPFEAHLPGHNFTGPGTKLNRRLNEDLTPKPWSIPINRVDDSAYRHDICYAQNRDAKTRNEVCDKAMLAELNAIDNPRGREKVDKALVKKIIGTKVRFGWGLKKTQTVQGTGPNRKFGQTQCGRMR